MKKILTIAFCALTLLSAKAANISIDPQATHKSPFQAGEKINTMNCGDSPLTCYRLFQGLTTEGYRILQDFYENGEKATDPFLIHSTVPFSDLAIISDSTNFIDTLVDSYKAWYPDGTLNTEIIITGPGQGILRFWYPNGQLAGEGEFSGDNLTRAQMWDQEGTPINDD